MHGACILLVEDDDVLRGLIERNLRERGHEVSVAIDAETAITHLRAQKFDLVFLDINLPDHTGWDVLRMAQHEGRLQPSVPEHNVNKLPVVILSAVRVNQSRLAEFHPLAYLPKPFPMDALLRLAAEAAQRKREDVHSRSNEERLNA